MLLEGLKQMTLRWLRIPPGTSVRKADGTKSNYSETDVLSNAYVSTMVDITVDDICIGDEPLSVNYIAETPEAVITCFKQIQDEFNTVVKWIAKDLCIKGVSVFDVNLDKTGKNIILLPHLEETEFYLTKDKKVVAYSVEDNSNINLDKIIIFINYEKQDLELVEDSNKQLPSSVKFKINPSPVQVKNAESTISAINNLEQAIQRYRMQLSRIARWVNVDIGSSQGDVQEAVVDSISSAINANSISLTGYTSTDFDDNLPVIPNRRGLGKPEIVSDIPNFDIKELADFDYYLNKLNLIMRFPASYMDFSKELGSSAVSLIRSDLRYTKLCRSVQSIIVNTINDFVQDSKFKEYEPVFYLTKIPSSEDDDVIQALSDYVDLSNTIEDFIMGGDTVKDKIHRLEQLQDLYLSSTTSKLLQTWFDNYREYIVSLKDSSGSDDIGDMDDFDSHDSFGDFGSHDSMGDFDSDDSLDNLESDDSMGDLESDSFDNTEIFEDQTE